MSTSWTTNIGLGQPALNDASWPTTLNNNWAELDSQTAIGAFGVTTTEYPSASLNVRVAGGTFQASTGLLVTVATVSPLLLTASQTNYIYITDSGTVTVSTSAFPSTGTFCARVATVVCGGTTVTSITDSRLQNVSGGANRNTLYLPLAGGTMTGAITASGAGANAGVILSPVSISGSTTEGQIAEDTSQIGLYAYVGGAASYINRSIFSQYASVNVNTSSSAVTLLSATAKGSKVLAANSLSVGKIYHFRASGFFPSTKSSSPGTLQFVIGLGGVTIGTLASAPTLGTSLTNAPWNLWLDVTVRAIGSGTSTNVFAQGQVNLPLTNSDSQTLTACGIANSAVSSGFDSTATATWVFTSQFSVNDATNSLTCSNVEISTDF